MRHVTEPRDPSCAGRFVVPINSGGKTNKEWPVCTGVYHGDGTSETKGGFDKYAETDEAESVETKISSFIDDLR